jgi:hypothetical protein
MSRLSLFVLIPMALFAGRAQAQEDARAILVRAIKAHGGAEAIAKYQARHIKIRGTLTANRDLPFIHELYYQAPGMMRDVLAVETDGKRSTIAYGFDGENGWIVIDGKPTSLPETMKSELKETAHLVRLSGLATVLAPGTDAALLAPIELAGRPTLGVRLSTRGYRDIALFFDKQTGLLVKAEHQALDSATQKLVKEERFYSDWKDVNGLRTPTHVEIFREGKKFMQADAVQVEMLEKLDAALFRQP